MTTDIDDYLTPERIAEIEARQAADDAAIASRKAGIATHRIDFDALRAELADDPIWQQAAERMDTWRAASDAEQGAMVMSAVKDEMAFGTMSRPNEFMRAIAGAGQVFLAEVEMLRQGASTIDGVIYQGRLFPLDSELMRAEEELYRVHKRYSGEIARPID